MLYTEDLASCRKGINNYRFTFWWLLIDHRWCRRPACPVWVASVLDAALIILCWNAAAIGERCLSSQLLEAIPAVNGTIVGGLERNLGLDTALGANNSEHFSFARSAGALAGGAALRATSGIVLKAFFCIEFLFRRRKSEFPAAFLASEYSVFKCHRCIILLNSFPNVVFVSCEAIRRRKASEEKQ